MTSTPEVLLNGIAPLTPIANSGLAGRQMTNYSHAPPSATSSPTAAMPVPATVPPFNGQGACQTQNDHLYQSGSVGQQPPDIRQAGAFSVLPNALKHNIMPFHMRQAMATININPDCM